MIIVDRVKKLEELVEMLLLAQGSWSSEEEGNHFKANRQEVFRLAKDLLAKKVKENKCKTCGR